jgi:hypothetical protein
MWSEGMMDKTLIRNIKMITWNLRHLAPSIVHTSKIPYPSSKNRMFTPFT